MVILTKTHDNSSDGHIIIGSFLEKLFPYENLLQEISYYRIMKLGYKKMRVDISQQHKLLMESAKQIRADWVVPNYDLVVEVQGEQHFGPVTFGGRNAQTAENKFLDQEFLDRKKRVCIKEIGWKLLEYQVRSGTKPNYDDFNKQINRLLLNGGL